MIFAADAPYEAPPPAEAANSEIIGIFMCIPFMALLLLVVILDTPVILSTLYDNWKAWTQVNPNSYAT